MRVWHEVEAYGKTFRELEPWAANVVGVLFNLMWMIVLPLGLCFACAYAGVR